MSIYLNVTNESSISKASRYGKHVFPCSRPDYFTKVSQTVLVIINVNVAQLSICKLLLRLIKFGQTWWGLQVGLQLMTKLSPCKYICCLY